MIKSFSLEFNNKEELDKVVDKLWFEKQVTGEV